MESKNEALNVMSPQQFGDSGFLRISKGAGSMAGLKAVSRTAAVPFLQETERLRAGMHCNFFELEEFIIENGTIRLDAELSLTSESSDIKMWAQLFDARSASAPLASYQMQEAMETADMHYKIYQPLSEKRQTDEIEPEIVVHAEWMNEAGGWEAVEIKASAVCDPAEWEVIYPKQEEDRYIEWNSSGPKECPVPDKKRTDEKIRISLFRKPDDVRDLDYLCTYGKDRAGHPILMIPGQGRITLRDEAAEFAEGKASMYCCLRKAGQSGAYAAAAGNDAYSTMDAELSCYPKYITYKMYQPWGAGFLEPGALTGHEFSYWIKLVYQRKGENVNHILWLADHIDYNKNYIQSVPHLLIMWGCLEGQSRICMADGRQKEIREIRTGEQVRTADGNTAYVSNVWKGSEDSVYQLCTKGGKKIKASGSHPFVTDAGTVAACRLKAGSAVRVWNEQKHCMEEELLTEAVKIEGVLTVYNLSLGGKQMIAEGFVCGDMELQNPCS